MPRNLIFVRIIDLPDGSVRRVAKGGREIHGLHYHRTTPKGKEPERGVYYAYRDGKRVRLGSDLASAIRQVTPGETYWTPERTRLHETHVELEIAVQDLLSPREGMREVPTPEAQRRIERLLQVAQQPTPDSPSIPSAECLSTCRDFWRDDKQAKRCRPSYVAETVRVFNEFIAVIGAKPVNQLRKTDFTEFERYMVKGANGQVAPRKATKGKATGPKGAQSNPNNWYMLRRKAVRAVLDLAVRKTEFPFPADLLRWLDAIDARQVPAAATNRQPLPADVFRAIIDLCEQRATIDVDALPTATDADNGRKAQAIIDKREAIQFAALLRLACQAALDNQDVCALKWSHVRLDAPTPHIDFPRQKPAWSTGQPIDRKTPLLPETARALIRWREYERPTEYVFRNARKAPWTYDDISRVFGQLKRDAGHNSYWSFKHLRNVAPTVRRDAKLPTDMSDTLLGHAIHGTSRFYTGDADETYLLPLVRAVGNRYFAQTKQARQTAKKTH